jgi:hypothetical protein
VVAYSRRCRNLECAHFGQHYHVAGHLKISLPYTTYGLSIEWWQCLEPKYGTGAARPAADLMPRCTSIPVCAITF